MYIYLYTYKLYMCIYLYTYNLSVYMLQTLTIRCVYFVHGFYTVQFLELCLSLFYIQATSKYILLVTVLTHSNFIVLPHWETRPPAL